MLRDKLTEAVKDAMKSGDKLQALDASHGAGRDQERRYRGARPARARSTTTTISACMQKLIKQRQDSVELYEKGGRAELAKQERDEIEIIKGFCRSRCRTPR